MQRESVRLQRVKRAVGFEALLCAFKNKRTPWGITELQIYANHLCECLLLEKKKKKGKILLKTNLYMEANPVLT